MIDFQNTTLRRLTMKLISGVILLCSSLLDVYLFIWAWSNIFIHV